MRNGFDPRPPQRFKDAVEKLGLEVHGFYVESGEHVLAPYEHAQDVDEANKLVAQLSALHSTADPEE
jgi:hypothetical protein